MKKHIRSKKLLFAISKGIPVLKTTVLLEMQTKRLSFPFEFENHFYQRSKKKKFRFDCLYKERNSRSAGLLIGYKFIVYKNLKMDFEVLKMLIEAADGEIDSVFPKIDSFESEEKFIGYWDTLTDRKTGNSTKNFSKIYFNILYSKK